MTDRRAGTPRRVGMAAGASRRPAGSRSTRRAAGPSSGRRERDDHTVASRPARRSRPAQGSRSRRSAPPLRRAHRRLVAVLAVFAVLFGLVVVRLVDLQVVHSGHYIEQGRRQRLVSSVLPAGRGSLLDRNGTELALSIPQRTIYADPEEVVDPHRAAVALAPILRLGADALERDLRGGGRYVVLARTVADAVADRVEALDLHGIATQQELARFTPDEDLARSLVGSVDVDGKGRSGLEAAYDDVLTGTSGSMTSERSPDGATIAGGNRQVVPAQPGNDVVLTIDQSLQFRAEQVLGAAIVKAGSKGGSAIVTRPGTGEVLALANMVADPSTGGARSTSNDLAVTVAFDPGSVNKVITISGALDEAVVEADDELVVPHELRVSDKTFSDDHSHPTEAMSITDVVADSSNVGTIMMAQQLGAERLDAYLRSFGFGSKTALDLEGETAGDLRDLDDWSGTSIGSIAIGQGITVTAVQMLAAYNVIANDGLYVAPRVANATVDPTGVRHDLPASARRRVVSAETARAMSAMMTEVVTRGTGTAAAVPGYTIAGKTGTARKVVDGSYLTPEGYKYVSTFAGLVPAEQPELSIIVVIDEPQGGSYYASDVAAPAFSTLARYALQELKVPPPATASDQFETASSHARPPVAPAPPRRPTADPEQPSTGVPATGVPATGVPATGAVVAPAGGGGGPVPDTGGAAASGP